jgi:DNA anti-recombination protein RmuC
MENPNAWLETLLYASLFLSLLILLLGAFLALKLLRGGSDGSTTELQVNFERIATLTARTEATMRDEQERLRRQTEDNGRELRREVNDGILQFGTSMQATLSDSRTIVDRRFEEFARTQAEFSNSLRDELRKTINTFGETLKRR